jgi:hypothetical protein
VATPPNQDLSLPKSEIVKRLSGEPWFCTEVKKRAVTTLWRTQFGFYFSVPDDCTEVDFEEIMVDLRKHGWKRNV